MCLLLVISERIYLLGTAHIRLIGGCLREGVRWKSEIGDLRYFPLRGILYWAKPDRVAVDYAT